jgi:hypothetical protein
MHYETKVVLRQLGYTSYTAYLRSDVWRMRRVAYFAYNARRCWICGTPKKIHLHHCNYSRIGGYERDADLLPLCQAHERAVHGYMRRSKIPVERAHLVYAQWLKTRKKKPRK